MDNLTINLKTKPLALLRPAFFDYGLWIMEQMTSKLLVAEKKLKWLFSFFYFLRAWEFNVPVCNFKKCL